jgi:hypothetical protein
MFPVDKLDSLHRAFSVRSPEGDSKRKFLRLITCLVVHLMIKFAMV